MDREVLADLLRIDIPKEVLIDLYDGFVAQTRAAFEAVRDHTGLEGKRARRADGFLRFLMNENAFEVVSIKHGGGPLEGGVLPGTNLAVFQPYKIFGRVVLGFASHIEPGELPTKNQTRRNAAQINFDLSDRLDIPEIKSGSAAVFALLLISRAPSRAGEIREVALAVVDSKHDHFLFYESIEKFMTRYAPDSGGSSGVDLPVRKPLVRLKPKSRDGEQSDESDVS